MSDLNWLEKRIEYLKQHIKIDKLYLETYRDMIMADRDTIIKVKEFLGYNLEYEPQMFDMIYTGTETRDPEYTHQHLQPYQSYSIMRYLENVSPGKNAGGWIDPFVRRYLDRYVGQKGADYCNKAEFSFNINPHSYQVFKIE